MKTISLFQKSAKEKSLANTAVNDHAMVLINGKMEKQIFPDSGIVDLPTFPDSVYQNLPAFLQKVVARCGSKEEKDMMLMGVLATIGSGLPKVYGFYGEKRVYPYPPH